MCTGLRMLNTLCTVYACKINYNQPTMPSTVDQ